MYFFLSYFLQGLVLHSQRHNKDFKYMNGESRRAVKLEPRTPGNRQSPPAGADATLTLVTSSTRPPACITKEIISRQHDWSLRCRFTAVRRPSARAFHTLAHFRGAPTGHESESRVFLESVEKTGKLLLYPAADWSWNLNKNLDFYALIQQIWGAEQKEAAVIEDGFQLRWRKSLPDVLLKVS